MTNASFFSDNVPVFQVTCMLTSKQRRYQIKQFTYLNCLKNFQFLSSEITKLKKFELTVMEIERTLCEDNLVIPLEKYHFYQ